MKKYKEPRLSHQALRILRLFVDKRNARIAGSDIAKETGLQSGTIYPVLARLEDAKWLESDWESVDPSKAGRPRKRLYKITGLGSRRAIAALTELGLVPGGRLAWGS